MSKNGIVIGVDFDNTIVSYDKIFHTAAVERGIIPKEIWTVREEVRGYLRKIGKEHLWTELQGYVYGPGILGANEFQGVKEFFAYCKNKGIKALIISHKTKEPFLGPKYDLHKHAMDWLDKKGFFSNQTGLTKKDVFFLLTKEEKAKKIQDEKCTHFIDDLPEVLLADNFPKGIFKILFDPNKRFDGQGDLHPASSWNEIIKIIS